MMTSFATTLSLWGVGRKRFLTRRSPSAAKSLLLFFISFPSLYLRFSRAFIDHLFKQRIETDKILRRKRNGRSRTS
jgi:hypothetical protein